jgi:hypothetical protein
MVSSLYTHYSGGAAQHETMLAPQNADIIQM